MKKRFLQGILFIIASFIAIADQANAQCEVKANAYPQVICAGDAVTLSASGGCGFLMNNDFNNGTIGVGWNSTQANPVFNNPCGPGPNGAHLWVGTTPSNSRTLITVDYDVSIGGCDIEWYMRYGRVQGSGNCEDPDAQNEGVHLQWSTNNGATWTDFPGPDQEPVGNLNTNPPFPTTTPGTGGYWQPHSSQSAQAGSELYYWNLYNCPIPVSATTPNTRFRWAQLATSSTGFDAWGIDEVEIKCPTGNLNVQWNHGPTVLNPPAVTLPPVGQVSYDTCFKVTIWDSINSATDSVCVTVNPIPTSDFTISDTSICGGDSTTFTYTGTATSQATYNWDFDGNSASGQGPHTHSFSGSGQKTVSLSVQENGCKSTTTKKTLSVHPYPSVSFFPDPVKTCIGDSISFINQTSPATSTWKWGFGDGAGSTQESPSHMYTAPGTYNVSLVATTDYGCVDSLTNIPITIYPKPVAAIDTTWIDYANWRIQFDDVSDPGSATSSITNWLWDFGSDASPSSSTSNSAVVEYTNMNNYTVKLLVTNNHGCSDSTTMKITIYQLEIPNVITPNADDVNDKFVINAIDSDVLKNVTLIIYNRWGKKVYENPNYDNEWDGDNLAEGTYYYILRFTSPRGEEEFHGSITVLR